MSTWGDEQILSESKYASEQEEESKVYRKPATEDTEP